MSHRSIPLNNIRVAAPCPADWNMMTGNDRVRFCGECKLNVYNLSDMTRSAAENLIAEHEGRLCVRFYRRADGTVLTQDCPTGLRARARRAKRRLAFAFSALLTFIMGLGLVSFLRGANLDGSGKQPPFETPHTMGAISAPPEERQPLMGNIAIHNAPRRMQGELEVGRVRVDNANRRLKVR